MSKILIFLYGDRGKNIEKEGGITKVSTKRRGASSSVSLPKTPVLAGATAILEWEHNEEGRKDS